MRDVVWTAVISIVLAGMAVAAGLVNAIWPGLHLLPLVEGGGLASITFGLAGLSDKFDPHSRTAE